MAAPDFWTVGKMRNAGNRCRKTFHFFDLTHQQEGPIITKGGTTLMSSTAQELI